MPTSESSPRDAEIPEWPEVMATVLSCTYSARVGRAVAFGLASSRHFHITYNYWAEGTLHTADFYSERAIPPGSIFPIRYDPEMPQRTRHAEAADTTTRVPLLAIGVAGSIFLSLIWLLSLRGCS